MTFRFLNYRRLIMGLYGPEWWHHHGTKMRVSFKDASAVSISGSAAFLRIWRAYPNSPAPWRVEWQIIHSQTTKIEGSICFSNEDLQNAFDVTSTAPNREDEWLTKVYQASFGRQGKYIREDDFLNIPCPGTGHDGDPNISIQLDDEIREAVCKLFDEKKTK